MATSPPAEPQQFEITDQQFDYVYDRQGNRVGQWTIHFKTPKGVASSIIVPASVYSAATVGPLIAHTAREIDAVHSLTQAVPVAPAPASHHKPAGG